MTISKDGIKPKLDKLSDFKNSTFPNTVKELRSFLGFATYFNSRIPNLANLADPLWKLTHNNVKYRWGEQLYSGRLDKNFCLIRLN